MQVESLRCQSQAHTPNPHNSLGGTAARLMGDHGRCATREEAVQVHMFHSMGCGIPSGLLLQYGVIELALGMR